MVLHWHSAWRAGGVEVRTQKNLVRSITRLPKQTESKQGESIWLTFVFMSVKIHFIGAWTITARNRYIQQAQVHTKLRTMMNDLAKGHADHFGFGGHIIYFIAIAHRPGR